MGESDSAFKLGNFSIDEARPIKVVAIGAGYSGKTSSSSCRHLIAQNGISGITAGIRFRQKVKNVDITIYESNAGVGGTWFANRYPVSRDADKSMHLTSMFIHAAGSCV